MVFLVLLLIIGLKTVTPEILTGTELPPIATFSGGTYDDLQLPLEHINRGSFLKVKKLEEKDNKSSEKSSDNDYFQRDVHGKEKFDDLNKSKTINGTSPTDYITNEGTKLNMNLSTGYSKNGIVMQIGEVTNEIIDNHKLYRFRMTGGKPTIVKPLNRSQTKTISNQGKTDSYVIKTFVPSFIKIGIGKNNNKSYLYHISSKNATFLHLNRPTTTIRPYSYRNPRLRMKSKNKNDVIKRRNTFLNELDAHSKTLNRQNVINEARFSHKFRTSNGIQREESGTAIDGVKVEGSYSYVGDDGKTYTVRYTADENGFRPQGDHIPSLPKALRMTTKQDFGYDDGSYDEEKYGHLNYENVFVRQAYKQYLGNIKRHRKHKLNEEVNNKGGVGNNITNHTNSKPKLVSPNTSNSNGTILSSTESKLDLMSNNNSKQTYYTIKRKSRKFDTENGYNKLYVVNPESIEKFKNINVYENDSNHSSDAKTEKVLKEYSETFATVGYIYGPPINTFNAEEKQFHKSKADIVFYDTNTFNNEKTSNVNTSKTVIEKSQNIKPTSKTRNIFDKINNAPIIKTEPNEFVNTDDDFISNAKSSKMKNTVTKPDFTTHNKQPSHLLDIFENIKSRTNITDEISLLRKLFGLPNATQIEDFKVKSLTDKDKISKENKNRFKSRSSIVNPVVDENILNKTNVANVEEILKSIFGTGENDKNSNLFINIDKEFNQSNKTDKNNESPKDYVFNAAGEQIEGIDGNRNIFEQSKENKVFIGKGEDFSGPKLFPKFDPDTGYYYKK